MPLEIVGIPGSIRTGSLNRKLLELADEFAGDRAHIDIVDLRPIPMYDPDAELLETPEFVLSVKRKIANADAVLFASPVYYISMPGVLKNAIDWICRPDQPGLGPSVFAGKPVAVIGGGGGLGSLLAQQQVKDILEAINAILLAEPVVNYVRLPDRVSDAGMLNDPADREQLAEFVSAFISHIESAGIEDE